MFFQEHLSRFAARTAAGLVAIAALASCGGGTYQVNTFIPARIITFGDESNKLSTAQGLKYSINAISSETGQIDCSLYPLWTQTLAAAYSLVYSNCNTEAVPSPDAIDYSTLDATVDDVANQVAAFQSGDSFNSNDMVTIWVGTHDLLTDYNSNGSSGDTATLTADMSAVGVTLANLVNSITNTGAKVILLTIPDLGKSPFGATEQARGDFDRQAMLSDMTTAFNLALRGNIVNDGSKIGLVLVDDFVTNAVNSPGSYGLISSPNETAGCLSTAVLPKCTDNTLVTIESTSTTASSFLWADATHLGPTAHKQIGSTASSRAQSNPF